MADQQQQQAFARSLQLTRQTQQQQLQQFGQTSVGGLDPLSQTSPLLNYHWLGQKPGEFLVNWTAELKSRSGEERFFEELWVRVLLTRSGNSVMLLQPDIFPNDDSVPSKRIGINEEPEQAIMWHVIDILSFPLMKGYVRDIHFADLAFEEPILTPVSNPVRQNAYALQVNVVVALPRVHLTNVAIKEWYPRETQNVSKPYGFGDCTSGRVKNALNHKTRPDIGAKAYKALFDRLLPDLNNRIERMDEATRSHFYRNTITAFGDAQACVRMGQGERAPQVIALHEHEDAPSLFYLMKVSRQVAGQVRPGVTTFNGVLSKYKVVGVNHIGYTELSLYPSTQVILNQYGLLKLQWLDDGVVVTWEF